MVSIFTEVKNNFELILESSSVDKAVDQAHTDPIGIWWYNIQTQELKYNKYRGANHFHGKTEGQARGRVFKDKKTGKNTIIIWMYWDFPRIRLSQDDIDIIARGIQDKINEPISYVVDEYGDSLVIESKLNMRVNHE